MGAEATNRTLRTAGPIWFRDFDIGVTSLVVRSTGVRVPYSPSVIAEVSAWFKFFFAVKAQIPLDGAPFTIYFTPERARPWYLIWPTVRIAGGKLAKDAASADVVMHFDDATYSNNAPPTTLKPGARLINFGCRDISKSRVAELFEQVFGYSLRIDPTVHVGPAVEKSELNAAHDGRIVQCPMSPIPGRIYQRLIETRTINPDLVEDLRTCTVGGKPVCVFLKRRPVTNRFANSNAEVLLARVEDIYTPEEQALLTAFAQRLGFDWGGLDVLRDRHDGRLYIVDANKTDMGPPIAAAVPEKLKAARMMARAFREFIGKPAV